MSNFSRYLSKNWLDDPKSNILSGLVVAFAMIPEAIAFSGIAGVPSKSGTAAFITTSGLSANKSGFIRHHDGAVGLNFDAEL